MLISTKVTTVSFDLLSNPFAILGLTPDTPSEAIMARAREIGTAEAAAASRTLLVPRTRLQAELSYLPGASRELAHQAISTLKLRRRPVLESFTTLARANVLAHIASQGLATADHLRDLARLQGAIRSTAGEAIGAARERARMPPVPPAMLETALDSLASQQAEAFTEGMLALATGADLFAEQLRTSASGATAEASFLRHSAAAWDRATASEATRDLESAAPIETALRDHPDPEVAERLGTFMLRFAARTRPPREARRLIGLPHQVSETAAKRWRALALDLNNRQDAVVEAVTVLEALVSGFGTVDDTGIRTARDLEICRERLESGEGTPEVRRLDAAIKAAIENELAFQRSALVNGRTTAGTPPVVAELCNAFVAAARTARSDLPWLRLRAFMLRLHNEFSATEAALAFTQLAIDEATGNVIAFDVIVQLRTDLRILRKEQLTLELSAALYKKEKRTAQRLLTELVNLTDNVKEKETFQAALRKVTGQQMAARLKYGFYAMVGIGVLYLIVTSNQGQPPAPGAGNYVPSTSAYNQPASSTHHGTAAQAAIQLGDGYAESQPPPGPTTLTRAELRWCQYHKARAQAARDYLRAMRANSALDTHRYNAGVDAYNSFIVTLRTACGNYRYWKADASVVDAELNQNAAILRAEGQQLIADAYRGAVAPAPSTVPSFVSPPSNPMSAAAASTEYGHGQADRQAWDSWFNGLSGPFQDGAGWWAGVRSLPRPPACSDAPGPDHARAVTGCRAARARLAGVDRRRLSEPSYRAGWNNP